MATASRQRVALAIIRVWLEDDHPLPLRARVTTIDDIAGTGSQAVDWAGGDREALLAHLDSWLDDWLAGAS